jgi:hypothetical protein
MADVVSVQVNRRQMRELERMLSAVPKRITTVVVQASNKTGITIRAKLARFVGRVLGLKVSTVKRYQVFLDKATKRRPVAHVGATNWPTKVGYLRPKQLKRGVKYGGPGGRKLIEGAFIATMWNYMSDGLRQRGHVGVFKRRTAARLPIDEQYGRSAGGILQPKEKEIEAETATVFEKNLSTQVQLMLEREARRRSA